MESLQVSASKENGFVKIVARLNSERNEMIEAWTLLIGMIILGIMVGAYVWLNRRTKKSTKK